MPNSKLTTLTQLQMLATRVKSEEDAIRTRVTELEEVGSERNVIVGIQKNGTDVAVDSTSRKVNITVPTNNNELTNGAGYQTASDVSAAIDAAISSTYKPGGSLAPAGVVAGVLIEANEGKVYNLSGKLTLDATTAALFVDGTIGDVIPAGTNIVVLNDGTAQTPSYKFDKMAGFIDLSDYVQKANGTAGNIVKLKADGSYEDTGIAATSVLTAHQDISDKADKVANATNGNLAGLDANGNLTDSGKKAADFVAAESGKRLMTDAEGTKLSGISDGATKVEASANEGKIKVDGTDVTVVTLATDAEVTTMLTSVFGAAS